VFIQQNRIIGEFYKIFDFNLIFSGLHMKMDSIRESTAAGLSVTVRKTGIILNVP
jgi:hypothetical protein